ncbi:MAG: hypothetical protein VYB39_00970 [Pseudomonadota bacterium]|nr:hypothetical protein [Pseudomonadota bacterium]
MWGLELLFLAWMPPFLEALAAWLMILYLLLNIPLIRGENIILGLLIRISAALITAYSRNWVASVFATQKIPGVSAWQIMSIGIVLAGLG